MTTRLFLCTRKVLRDGQYARCTRAAEYAVVLTIAGFETTLFVCGSCHRKARHLAWRKLP